MRSSLLIPFLILPLSTFAAPLPFPKTSNEEFNRETIAPDISTEKSFWGENFHKTRDLFWGSSSNRLQTVRVGSNVQYAAAPGQGVPKAQPKKRSPSPYPEPILDVLIGAIAEVPAALYDHVGNEIINTGLTMKGLKGAPKKERHPHHGKPIRLPVDPKIYNSFNREQSITGTGVEKTPGTSRESSFTGSSPGTSREGSFTESSPGTPRAGSFTESSPDTSSKAPAEEKQAPDVASEEPGTPPKATTEGKQASGVSSEELKAPLKAATEEKEVPGVPSVESAASPKASMEEKQAASLAHDPLALLEEPPASPKAPTEGKQAAGVASEESDVSPKAATEGNQAPDTSNKEKESAQSPHPIMSTLSKLGLYY